jgi:hypothetical protein
MNPIRFVGVGQHGAVVEIEKWALSPGTHIGVSYSGHGSLDEQGNIVDYRADTFNLVADPSVEGHTHASLMR